MGVDISDIAIANADSLEIENASFFCIDGHILPFNDLQFDCVIVNSLLHHMDLKVAFSEISRVLKSDGFLIFREPLGTNPLLQLYRVLSPYARTPDERPFNFRDLSLMGNFFVLSDVRWFGFLCLFSAFLRFDCLRKFLTGIDSLLSKTILKYLFWQFSGFVKKK